MIITGLWTTDESGRIVFVRFEKPLVLSHQCEGADDTPEAEPRALP